VPLYEATSPSKPSGMARVVNGSHSFTCHPRVYPRIEMNHTCLCLPSRSWSSFTDRGWIVLYTFVLYCGVCLLFRVSATLSCPMTLHKFPLDTQTCPMMFESCKYCAPAYSCSNFSDYQVVPYFLVDIDSRSFNLRSNFTDWNHYSSFIFATRRNA